MAFPLHVQKIRFIRNVEQRPESTLAARRAGARRARAAVPLRTMATIDRATGLERTDKGRGCLGVEQPRPVAFMRIRRPHNENQAVCPASLPRVWRKHMAALRSFVASCELANVDPFAGFQDVLSRIGAHSIQQLDELLPHCWAAARL